MGWKDAPVIAPPKWQDAPAMGADANNARAAAARAGTLPQITPERAAQQAAIDQMAMPQPEKSWMQTAKDNIFGDNDPTTQNPGEKFGSAVNAGVESLTLGLIGDEFRAGLDTLIGRGNGYDANLAAHRADEQKFQQENPGTDLAARVAPMLIPYSAAGGIVSAAKTLPQAVVRSGLLGGAQSGLLGFMEGEGGAQARAESGIKTGLIGGGIAGAIPPAGAVVKGLLGSGARGQSIAAAKAVESTDDLVAAAASKYDEAKALGIAATQAETTGLASTIKGIASSEGLITPKGRIAESYPKIRDAINMVDDFASGIMNPDQMQAVRRTFQSAAGSADGAERRVGTIMLKAFDDFVEPLAPQFKEANALYSRAMKGRVIEEAVDLAGNRAGQFTGSGFENALRTEFRRLNRDIIKGRLRGLTDDQISAIKKVAEGGPVENVLRGIGKAAPTGIVSAGIGGGMPFLVGNSLGGPALGGLLSGGTMLAGGLGRKAATAMQRGNADIAAGLMRSANGAAPQLSNVPQSGMGLLGAVAPTVEYMRHPTR